jgi:hypothetical protein
MRELHVVLLLQPAPLVCFLIPTTGDAGVDILAPCDVLVVDEFEAVLGTPSSILVASVSVFNVGWRVGVSRERLRGACFGERGGKTGSCVGRYGRC